MTHGEVQTKLAQVERDDARLEAALADFAHARALAGCQNRVNYLNSRALLERASRKRARGEDVSTEVNEVLAIRERTGAATLDVPLWRELFEDAERMGAR